MFLRINSRSVILSNCEVYNFLQELCEGDKQKGKRSLIKTQTHLANIAFDVSIFG